MSTAIKDDVVAFLKGKAQEKLIAIQALQKDVEDISLLLKTMLNGQSKNEHVLSNVPERSAHKEKEQVVEKKRGPKSKNGIVWADAIPALLRNAVNPMSVKDIIGYLFTNPTKKEYKKAYSRISVAVNYMVNKSKVLKWMGKNDDGFMTYALSDYAKGGEVSAKGKSIKKEKQEKGKLGRKWKYPFPKMEVNDSFLISCEKTNKKKFKKLRDACATASRYFIKKIQPNWQFSIRAVTGGFRCWRVK